MLSSCQHKIRLALAFGKKDIVTAHVQSKVVRCSMFDYSYSQAKDTFAKEALKIV